jgi:hypothetical protein
MTIEQMREAQEQHAGAEELGQNGAFNVAEMGLSMWFPSSLLNE